MDIDSLVSALSEEEPSGPDLSYDAERQLIESVFERSVGADRSDEEDTTDWRGTIQLILAQGQRTRDLWLPVYMMRAAAQIGNFEQLGEAAEWLARLMEDRWPDLHPQLDEYGFIGRKTPVEALTRIGDFLGPLLRVPLLTHPRLGSYSGADLIRFDEEGSSAENYGMFRALLEATDTAELEGIAERVDALRAAIRRADAVLTANAEGDTATNFALTYEYIDKLRHALAANLPGGAVPETADVTGDGEEQDVAVQSGGGGTAGPGLSGAINSRGDVVKALDAICAYYTRVEPGSPVPLILQRARAWTSLDFLAVLEEIAPNGIDEAKRVLTGPRSSYD